MRKAYLLNRFVIVVVLLITSVHSDTWKIYNNSQRTTNIYVSNDTIWALVPSIHGSVVGIPKNGTTKVFRNKFNCPLKGHYLNSFLVSSNGSQYFGTDSGLTVLENLKWRQITTKNSVLPNNDIKFLAEDKLGWIWVGTYQGIAKIKNDSIVAAFKNNPLDFSMVNYIFVDSTNRKWFSNGSLCCYDDSIWTVYDRESIGKPFGPVSSLAQSRDSTIWFTGFYNSVFAFKNGKWTFFDSTITGIPEYSANYVTVDRNNVKWFATDSGFVLFNDTTWVKLKPDNPTIPHNFGKTIFTKNNELFVSTDSGIVSYNGKNWERIDVANSGMRVSAVSSIAIDPMNRKWIGTDGGGVVLFDDKKWITFDSLSGNLLDNSVYGIVVGPDSAIWLRTSKGISKYYNSSWKSWYISGALGRTDDWATSFYVDKRNGVWLGRYYGSVRLFDHDSLKLIKYYEMEANHTLSILQTNDSILLFGSHDFRLRSFNLNTNSFKVSEEMRIPGDINQMVKDKNGQVWAGTMYNGVRLIDPVEWFSRTLGTIESEVFSVAIDRQDNKWFGLEYGVMKYDNHTWTRYSSINSGLFDTYTFAIALDSLGNVWFGTREGLSMLTAPDSGITRNINLHKKIFSSDFLHASFITKERLLIKSNLNVKSLTIYDLRGRCLFRTGIQNYDGNSLEISIRNNHFCLYNKILIVEVTDNRKNIIRTQLKYVY